MIRYIFDQTLTLADEVAVINQKRWLVDLPPINQEQFLSFCQRPTQNELEIFLSSTHSNPKNVFIYSDEWFLRNE